MERREIHGRILSEHRALRALVSDIDGLVEHFEGGDPSSVERLRDGARDLYLRFEAHLSFEDVALLPALHRTRGAAEAEALVREHAEQRELLDFLLRRLALPGRPETLLARELQQFGALLREDMQEEERRLASGAAADGSAGLAPIVARLRQELSAKPR